jgi:D-glycero-D-manno-heptose 1,7-bisphosphate phosphatase
MTRSKSNRAIFLDRDGTIMEDANYCGDVSRVILIPGAVESLRRLQDAGYWLFVVTNQSGIGRGYFTHEAVLSIHRHLDEQFGLVGVSIDHYYVCPHHPEDKCDCRKPRPRFLFEAAREHRLDLARSYMVGDRPSDVQAGINAGTRTILLLTGAGRETLAAQTVSCDYVAKDIAEATDWILDPAQDGTRGAGL